MDTVSLIQYALGLAFDLCNVGTDSIPPGVRVRLTEVAVKKADLPQFDQF